MKITIKIFAILMLIPIAFCFSSENEYYSKNKIIEYADYLFLNNEYRAAINEYQRAYYISEKKSEKHKLKSNIGRCYYMLGEFNSAVDVYRSIINNISERQFLCETKYLIGLAYFNNGNYSLSKQYLLENTSQIQDFVLLEKNQLLYFC